MSRTFPVTILICLLCVGVFNVAVAQDSPSPTPTSTPDVPDHLYDWDVEVLYPAAVRFTIVVDRPLADIQNVTITLQPEESNPITVPVNAQQAAVFAEAFTEFAFTWQITPANSLPFDTIVEYSWSITTGSDGIAVAPGAFFYTDTRVDWNTFETNSLTLALPESEATAASLLDITTPLLDLLEANTGESLDLAYALFPPDLSLNPCEPDADGVPVVSDPRFGTIFECTDDLIQSSFDARGFERLQFDYRDVLTAQATFTERFVPIYYAELWENQGVPAWFKAGLVQFYLPNAHNITFSDLQTRARSNALFDYTQMIDDTLFDTLDWRDQSLGMTLYIASRNGVDTLFDIANQAAETEDFATLYEEITGQPLAVIIPNMADWLFTSAGATSFNYTPYRETTATPTATDSATPFPPTLTFTPTATPTNTATATATGFLSATPLPSLTFTPTLLTSTPSLTPRPAGSIINPTATPVPVQSTDEADPIDPTVAAGLIGGIFGLFLILIIVVIRRNRGNNSND